MLVRWFKDFAHNCIIHPLLPFLPTELGDKLHNWSAELAFKVDDTVKTS